MPSEIARLWLENPLQGDPGQAIAQATKEEAEARRVRIRIVMTKFYEQWVPLITKAYVHRDWTALGYAPGESGWEDYCRDNYHPDVLLPREQRRQMIEGLHFAGMSQRAIGAAVGISQRTVARSLPEQLTQDAAVDATVISLDGRRRPATTPKAAETIEATEIYVPEREREFPEVEPSAPPVVFSATPGGTTAESGDERPQPVSGWRRMARQALGHAIHELNAITGEFTDPAEFAGRGDDQLLDELDKLSRRLSAFCADVWALRGRYVWLSSPPGSAECWHEIGTDEVLRAGGATAIDEGRAWDTLCGRATSGGVVMAEVQAVSQYGTRPCKACQEAMS